MTTYLVQLFDCEAPERLNLSRWFLLVEAFRKYLTQLRIAITAKSFHPLRFGALSTLSMNSISTGPLRSSVRIGFGTTVTRTACLASWANSLLNEASIRAGRSSNSNPLWKKLLAETTCFTKIACRRTIPIQLSLPGIGQISLRNRESIFVASLSHSLARPTRCDSKIGQASPLPRSGLRPFTERLRF